MLRIFPVNNVVNLATMHSQYPQDGSIDVTLITSVMQYVTQRQLMRLFAVKINFELWAKM